MGPQTGHLSCLQSAVDFFGFFQPSVAQASSEGWFGRVPDPRLRYFFARGAALRADVIGPSFDLYLGSLQPVSFATRQRPRQACAC